MVRDGQWTIGTLTGRQMEVLDLLAEGMSTADIATKLWVSKATVRNHVQQIMERLDVHTRLAAVHAAHVYVHSPGQRIIDWCRSQRMQLESSQEVAIRRVFEKKNAAPRALPAQVTVSTTHHGQVLLPARDANAADRDWGQRREHVTRRHRPRKPPPPLDAWLHRGRDITTDKPAGTTALLTFSCTGCAVVKTDDDRPVNDIAANTGNRPIEVRRGEQTITVKIPADSAWTLDIADIT